MSTFLKDRFNQVLLLIIILIAALLIRLFVLTVIQKDDWTEAADTLSTKDIYTSAPRGEILDRYGNVLAGNAHIFSVQMSTGDMDDNILNKTSAKLIKTLEKNNDKYNDNLPIKVDKKGKYYFTYDKEVKDWLKGNDIPTDYTAEEAFSYLRNDLGIDKNLSDADAQVEMQNTYNEYPPISIKKMKFTYTIEKETFLERFHLKKNLTAKDAFKKLRNYFKISAQLSDKQARKIMVVRNELSSMGYRQYMPTTIAQDVSNKTTIVLEEEADSYPGVEVASETIRTYPYKETASHIIGYLGKISESEKDEYVNKKGYRSTDLIGKDGIEGAFEDKLRGKDGVKKVQVDTKGKLVKTVSEEDPEKGKDIFLSIDINLQTVAEKALKQAIDCARTGGTFKSKYGNIPYSEGAKRNCVSGAVVAIEVKTGDVLALASYPGFDPNLFASGITSEDWAKLQSENPRDPLAATPLYNIATRSAVQPGSTFKPVTATTALQCGLNPNQVLVDGGAIKFGNKTFGCVVWNLNGGNHGGLTLQEAIEVSCNYYFYDVGTGKDWYSGASLGYKTPISIGKIIGYAKQYGLGKATGIEIPETVADAPTEASKISSVKNSLKNDLLASAETYFKPEVTNKRKKLNKSVETIVSWADKDYSYDTIAKKLEELGTLRENKVTKVADLCKFTYFTQAKWSTGDAFNISIGQGENAYTPLQMANYVATLGNKGEHNNASLVDSIEGEGKVEKGKATKVKVKDDEYFDIIIGGMKRVANGSRGSLRKVYDGFPVTVAGKTGTAQRAGKINTSDEVKYIKEHLGSFLSGVKWADVEKEMKRIMKKYPDLYTSKNTAVRRAVINLSDGKLTTDKLDRFKSSYDNFAWVVSMAPADDPKIAVAVMLVQGGASAYSGPVAREVIGQYLQVDSKNSGDYNIDAEMQ